MSTPEWSLLVAAGNLALGSLRAFVDYRVGEKVAAHLRRNDYRPTVLGLGLVLWAACLGVVLRDIRVDQQQPADALSAERLLPVPREEGTDHVNEGENLNQQKDGRHTRLCTVPSSLPTTAYCTVPATEG